MTTRRRKRWRLNPDTGLSENITRSVPRTQMIKSLYMTTIKCCVVLGLIIFLMNGRDGGGMGEGGGGGD